MRHTVECLVHFEQVHDLGPTHTVSLGDYLDWSGRFSREVRSPRTSIQTYRRGERIGFATHAAAIAFLNFHNGKFKYIGVH